MEINGNMMTGEELKSVLQPTTPNRYRWNVDVAKAYENLLWHYHRKVSESGRVYHDSIAVKEAMRAIASFITSDDYHFGIMLCGQPGNGKTTLMHAIYNVCRYRGESALFTTGKKIIRAVEDGMDVEIFQGEKLMFIDDLGAERKEVQEFGNVLTPMVDLLEHRYAKRLFTVVTTNLDADQLGEKYGARLRDRFREMFIVVPFTNPSFR